jgi:hypothetical protein
MPTWEGHHDLSFRESPRASLNWQLRSPLALPRAPDKEMPTQSPGPSSLSVALA